MGSEAWVKQLQAAVLLFPVREKGLMKCSVIRNSVDAPLCLLNGQRKCRVKASHGERILFRMFLSIFLQENNFSHLPSHADSCIIY